MVIINQLTTDATVPPVCRTARDVHVARSICNVGVSFTTAHPGQEVVEQNVLRATYDDVTSTNVLAIHVLGKVNIAVVLQQP